MSKRQARAMTVLAGVILVRGFASGGINMTASLFLPSVAGELRVGIGTLSVYFSIMSVVTVLWLPLAGGLINRYPVRLLVPLAAALQALSFAGFGLMRHVAGWYLLCVPQAMGAAILTGLLGPILINRWFPRSTGRVLGLQMACVWLFAAALQPLTSRMIEQRGWRDAYIASGLTAFAVMAAAALLLLRDRPADREAQARNPGDAEPFHGVQIAEREAVHSASFALLLIFMIAMTGAAVFTQHIPTYGAMLGYSLSQSGLAMALSSVGSAVGSLAIGLVCDRVGGLKTCYGVIALWMLAVAGFLLGGAGFGMFAAASLLHGAASASIAVIAPILTIAFYGKRDYERIYAKVSMGAPLSSILLVPAYGFIYDATGSYAAVLVLMLALLCAAGLGIMLGWRKRCTAAGCPTWRK